MSKLTATLARFFKSAAPRPVEVYLEPVGAVARPEGTAANPLVLRGLFIS